MGLIHGRPPFGTCLCQRCIRISILVAYGCFVATSILDFQEVTRNAEKSQKGIRSNSPRPDLEDRFSYYQFPA
jgi:hypothetical protein